MRHTKKRLQLNRFTSWHKATLKSLARSLLIYQSIKTTRSKAFAVKPLVEKLITLAKENSLTAKRRAYKVLCDHKLVSLLFSDIGPRFKNKNSGFVRIIGFGTRRGDGAELSILELTEIKKKEVKSPKKEHAKEPSKTETKPSSEVKPRTETAVKEERHPETKKQSKKFLGGIRKIFRKERESL